MQPKRWRGCSQSRLREGFEGTTKVGRQGWMREGCGRDAGGMREGVAGAESGTDDKLTSMMSAVDARRVRRARGAEEGRAFCTRDE